MSEPPSEERQVADDQPTDGGMASESPLAQTDPASKVRPLRIWPAALLVLCLWGVQFVPTLFDEVSLPLLTAQFLGPAVFALLIVLWWVFLSRASLGEKALGVFGLVAIGVVATILADKSIQGYGFIISPVPWGVSAFAAALICLARMRSTKRMWLALLAAAIGFGYWDLVRSEEIYGDFQSTRSWRWQPAAEDRSQDRLAAREAASGATLAELAGHPLVDPEWPGFRGPNRDGVVPGVVLAEEWRTQPPTELWRAPVGPGWSSFSVAGRRLFTQEQRGDREVVVCYDADSGIEVWVHEDEARFWEVVSGPGPRATPTLSDGKLYTLGAQGLLNCLDPIAGDLIWQRDIRKDANREPPEWGFAASPLATDGVVIVHAGGGQGKGVLAYDTATGDLRWTSPAGDHSYSSPQLSSVDGKPCVLMLTNRGITLVDPADGRLLGRHDWQTMGPRIVQPLVLGDSSVLLGSEIGSGTRRIEVQWNGERFTTKTSWTSRRMQPYFNDYVAHEGHLYGFDNNIFACVDLATGERRWKKGRYGNGQVLLLPSGDQLLVISEYGELVLLRATPGDLVELARHRVLEGRTWNHPVLVGNRVYVRNAEEAACFEVPTL